MKPNASVTCSRQRLLPLRDNRRLLARPKAHLRLLQRTSIGRRPPRPLRAARRPRHNGAGPRRCICDVAARTTALEKAAATGGRPRSAEHRPCPDKCPHRASHARYLRHHPACRPKGRALVTKPLASQPTWSCGGPSARHPVGRMHNIYHDVVKRTR